MRIGMLLFFSVLVSIFVTGPILMIWSLNTLFGLGIAYNLKTWFAGLILCALFSTNVGAWPNKE